MSFTALHLAPVMHLEDGFADIVEGGYDLIVRIGKLRDSNLVARRTAPAHMVMCASPAYLEKHGEPQNADDMPNHNCLMYTLGSSPRAWRLVSPAGEERMVPLRGNVVLRHARELPRAATKPDSFARHPCCCATRPPSGCHNPVRISLEESSCSRNSLPGCNHARKWSSFSAAMP